MVGGKTFDDSLEILAPFGRLVTYWNGFTCCTNNDSTQQH